MADLVEEKKHARLSPSGSKRWMTCPGSINLVESLKIKDKPSIYAAEGTVAHEVHELCLTKSTNAKKYFGKTIIADNMKFKVNDDMVEAVKTSLDFIRDRIEEMEWLGFRAELKVEVRSSLKYLGLDGLDGGTSDVVILYRTIKSKEVKAVDVIDYKHGKGVAVEVVNNTQGMCYALGICEKYNVSKDTPINIIISQPRAFHQMGRIRSWEITAETLYKWCKEKLIPAAKETAKKDAKLVPSEDGCRFCGAAGQCSKLFHKTQELAMIDFDDAEPPKLPDPQELTTEQKTAIVKYSNMIRAFIVAVENQVKIEVDSGNKNYDEEFKLVRKTTNRKFKDDALDEINSPLLHHLEKTDLFIEKPRSLGEIEKRLKKKIGAKEAKPIIEEITFKPEGELVIAPLSDKRRAENNSSQSDFKDLEI